MYTNNCIDGVYGVYDELYLLKKVDSLKGFLNMMRHFIQIKYFDVSLKIE